MIVLRMKKKYGSGCGEGDMEESGTQTWNLSKKFTPPDFQAKNFTPSISPNFNSVSGKNTKNE